MNVIHPANEKGLSKGDEVLVFVVKTHEALHADDDGRLSREEMNYGAVFLGEYNTPCWGNLDGYFVFFDSAAKRYTYLRFDSVVIYNLYYSYREMYKIGEQSERSKP